MFGLRSERPTRPPASLRLTPPPWLRSLSVAALLARVFQIDWRGCAGHLLRCTQACAWLRSLRLAYYNGVLASCGQQGGSGRWAIRAYVLVGFPLALAMAFPLKLGTLGLVVGHTVGKVCHTLPCMVLSRRIDWRLEGQRAVERVQCLSADGSQVPLVPRS
uniref:Uncharacterized protein n=1 Tax=Alexandrium monilatum TaxID=311494 RepID=A0A7S4R1U6_9DINO